MSVRYLTTNPPHGFLDLNANDTGICPTIDASIHKWHTLLMVVDEIEVEEMKVLGDLYESNGHNSMGGRVYSTDDIAPTIGASHFQQVKYIIDKKEVLAYDEQNNIVRENTVGTITTDGFSPKHNNRVIEVQTADELGKWIWEIDGKLYRIRLRRLTPKELYRLMGFCKIQDDGTFDDSAFDRAREQCSDTQLMKQAGNSIVVDCLEQIFKELFF